MSFELCFMSLRGLFVVVQRSAATKKLKVLSLMLDHSYQVLSIG